MAMTAWQLMRRIGTDNAVHTPEDVNQKIKLIWFARPSGVALVADLGDDSRSSNLVTIEDLAE